MATHAYNGRGQRVRKTANGGTTYLAYGEDGRLLFEYNTAGTLNGYLWLGNLLVGVATPEGAFAIETDHLGAPRVASNGYGATAWRWPMWDNAFGQQPARSAPSDGDGPSLNLNLRFPGQYYDAETGLHYNYFRDYEPTTGRYIESDPIGLDGGINTYGYAYQDPLKYIDPDGRLALAIPLVPPACKAIGAGIGALIGVITYHMYLDCDNDNDGSCEDEEEEECRREIRKCEATCRRAQTDPDMKEIWGGSWATCMLGCVSWRCMDYL